MVISPETWRDDVTSVSFWLKGHPKHADYSCETRALDLVDLLPAIQRRANAESGDLANFGLPSFVWREGSLYYCDSPEDLDEMVDALSEVDLEVDLEQSADPAPGM